MLSHPHVESKHTLNFECYYNHFHPLKVISRMSEDNEQPEDTKVSVELFDDPPMTFTVPGDIPWSDPKFSEVVAQEALDRYKQNAV